MVDMEHRLNRARLPGEFFGTVFFVFFLFVSASICVACGPSRTRLRNGIFAKRTQIWNLPTVIELSPANSRMQIERS